MDMCREIARVYRVLPPAVAEDLSERQILEEYLHALVIRQDDWHTLCGLMRKKFDIPPMDLSWMDPEPTRPRKSQRQLYDERKARLASGQ